MSSTSFNGESAQLSLDIKEPSEKIVAFSESGEHLPKRQPQSLLDLVKTPEGKRIDQRAHWLTLGAITTSILLFIAMLPPGNSPTSKGIAENFIGIEPAPVNPIQRNLPVMQAAKRSALFQLGLFRHLKGAEYKQSELITLGLSPMILKKVTGDGIMYALVIGLEDETEHKLILEILKANDIDYFQAKRSGS